MKRFSHDVVQSPSPGLLVRGGWLLLVMTGVLPTIGCSHLKPTRSGYLSDYSQLQTKETHKPLIWAHHVEVGGLGLSALTQYDSFMIEPVTWLAEDRGSDAFAARCKKNLCKKLHQALVSELGRIKPIVDEPGPRTAVVHAAVTQVAFARPVINSALTVVAVPIFNGGGVVEAEVILPDGSQAAAVVAALPGRATDVVGFFTWQGHAEKAMNRAADELRTSLTEPVTIASPREPDPRSPDGAGP